jgi:hypothetical protein
MTVGPLIRYRADKGVLRVTGRIGVGMPTLGKPQGWVFNA